MTFTATAVLPYDNLERATAGLRGRLRLIIAGDPDALPDWATLVVTGPTTSGRPGQHCGSSGPGTVDT